MPKDSILSLIVVACCLLVNALTASTGIEEEVNIYEKIYNASLYSTENRHITVNELYNDNPLLIGLIFTQCSGVCNPFLLQLNDNLQSASNHDSVNVLIVSFDPRDDKEDMDLLAQRLGLADNKRWTFAVTDSISELNESIGFYPVWDTERRQFEHDALLVGVNKEGYITKKLMGIRRAGDLSLLIGSVNNAFSPTYRLPGKSTLFSCFNYDPTTGKSTPGLGLLFIALPAVLTGFLILFIRYVVRI